MLKTIKESKGKISGTPNARDIKKIKRGLKQKKQLKRCNTQSRLLHLILFNHNNAS